jgi:hypothetical protein
MPDQSVPHPAIAETIAHLQQALRLLQDPTPDNLRAARTAARDAAERVPYAGEAPNCHGYRDRMTSGICTTWRICGRCRSIHDTQYGPEATS